MFRLVAGNGGQRFYAGGGHKNGQSPFCSGFEHSSRSLCSAFLDQSLFKSDTFQMARHRQFRHYRSIGFLQRFFLVRRPASEGP